MSTLANTYQNIKSELIRNKTELPNPAVYSIETDLSYPIEETFLPVAKRRFVKFLTAA
jgi:predicted transglutaminase-like protease